MQTQVLTAAPEEHFPRSRLYVLDGETPVATNNSAVWATWMFQHGKEHARVTRFGRSVVSTVFLGVDHGMSGADAPVLFETMILGGVADGYQIRTCTWAEARYAHTQAVCTAREAAGMRDILIEMLRRVFA